MGPGGRGQEPAAARFVYVARFGSHQCDRVLRLGGRGARGWRSEGGPREAAGARDSRDPPSRPGRGPPAAAAAAACPQPRASSAGSGPPTAARAGGEADAGASTSPRHRAGLIQKDAAKKFDFPIPLHEASKIMKKRKKVSVWKNVYKVISRMIEENEKYRLRLECQKLSRENSNCTR